MAITLTSTQLTALKALMADATKITKGGLDAGMSGDQVAPLAPVIGVVNSNILDGVTVKDRQAPPQQSPEMRRLGSASRVLMASIAIAQGMRDDLNLTYKGQGIAVPAAWAAWKVAWKEAGKPSLAVSGQYICREGKKGSLTKADKDLPAYLEAYVRFQAFDEDAASEAA